MYVYFSPMYSTPLVTGVLFENGGTLAFLVPSHCRWIVPGTVGIDD